MESAGGAPLVPQNGSCSNSGVEKRTIQKLDRRVLFPCLLVVVISYVDRSNIGYAARDLCNDLKLSHEEYGVGVSLFFAGYLPAPILGNALLRRFGAPTWIALMMFTWGCVATSFGFIQNTTQLYVLRVLLGFAEGGTWPALFNYFSLFYPEDHITCAYTAISAAICFAMPLSAPVSAGLLSLGSHLDMQGWRLLFIVEGLLPIVFALYLYYRLPESPRTATFLDVDERKWIISGLKEKHTVSRIALLREIKTVVACAPWWLGTLCQMLCFGISNVLMSWAALIIHNMLYGEHGDEKSETCGSKGGETALSVLLTAVPYIFSGTMCLFLRCYNIRNRPRFVAVVKILSGSALIIWGFVNEVTFFIISFLLLICSIGCGYVAGGPITGLTLSFFDSSEHATASAMFNMGSCLGGLVFPPIIGRLIDVYGYGSAVSMAGCVLLLAAIIISFVRDPLSDQKQISDSEPYLSAETTLSISEVPT